VATTLAESPDLAFERMYETYARIVYRYALAVLRNPADAEDITQTTFLNAYRAMKAGERPLNPRHWLLKIAHNSCRMRWVRNSRRPQEVPLDDKVERIAMPESERPSLRAVLDELGKLPFNQRSALVMRELEGRTYEEIAETLDVSVSAVETLLVRARRSMRLRKSAINVLGAAQLPASLESFLGGGAVVATGGALVGGVAFKAAAVLVAGLVAGGAGYTAVGATKKSPQDRSDAPAAAVLHVERGAARATPRAAAARAQHGPRASTSKPTQLAAAVPVQHEPAAPQTPAGSDAAPAAAPAESPAHGLPSAPATTTTSAAAPAAAVPVSAPAPVPVQPPQLPVQSPAAPTPVPVPPLPLPSPPPAPTVAVPQVIPNLP
jgi:RNA polymerase sigma factor (sigma-70 family)